MKYFKFPIIYTNLEALKVEKKKKYLKAKPCRACTFPFVPRVSTQVACCPNCALELNRRKKSKAFDAETRKRKEGIKKRSEWLREAQTAFNKYIRLRDYKEPCISCSKPREVIEAEQGWKTGGCWDAGHFMTRGAKCQLRFILFNVHKQKHRLPKWLYGRFPHQHMFDSWGDMKTYIKAINSDPDFAFPHYEYKRWMFFDGPWMA